MFLIQCVMLWSVCLPVWSALQVTQPYKVVSTNGSAQVQCFVHPPPSHQLPEPEELRVSLLKGLHSTQTLCMSTLNPTELTAADVEGGQVQCSAQLRDGTVKLSVTRLRATDTDLYRCQIEVLFPPPYLRLRGNGTLIHVLESSECPVQKAQRQTEEEDEERDERTAPVSVPVVVLVILVTVSLLFIIYLQALQCKDRRREMLRPVPVPVPVPGVHYKGDAAFSC